MIEIAFGMALDGARWSEESASVGKITCGPLGMLKFLETRLGLGGVEAPLAERIGAYLEKVRSVYAAEPAAWGAASFELDDWTTAKRLLSWRDELVDAGWDGVRGGSDRLDLLAKVEAAGQPTPPGVADRVRRVMETCTRQALDGTSITLVDDLAKYPRAWKTLFGKLGVASQWRKPELPKTVQVKEVTAANELQLAGLFVRDLRAWVDAKKSVAIIAEGDTGILDGFLHRAGLPALGRSASSAERAAIQILPLWIEYMWKPFSPMTLLALLTSQVSPVAPGKKIDGKYRKVGRRLVDALKQEPGIGGEAWNAAWEEIGPEFAADREMLEAPGFDPEGEGIPYKTFAERIDWLVKKLSPKVAEGYDYLDVHCKNLLKGTIRDAALLKKLAGTRRKLDRVTLRRLLETIVATGAKLPSARREVAPWRLLANPGQLLAPADCVLWWGFSDTGSSSCTYWTREERDALGDGGWFDGENATARQSDGWLQSLVQAKEELRLYHPLMAAGTESGVHPFRADLIHHGYVKDEDPVIQEDDSVLAVVATALEEKPAKDPVARVPPDDGLNPRSVSATQLKTLLSCPYNWYLSKHAGLVQADALSLPTGAPMIGTLAHKVVELIIAKHPGVAASEAGTLAEAYFDELVPQMAAELEAPDRRTEWDHYRRTLRESVETLWETVQDKGLKFVCAEKVLDREGAFHGLDFTGRADIVLEDAGGRPYVIDLKWSSGKHYIEAAEQGRSVQLASYAWAIDPVDMAVGNAYYMFPTRNFHESRQDDRETWQKIETDYARTIAELRRGELHRGYGKKETELGLEPECTFCPFKTLCGFERKDDR